MLFASFREKIEGQCNDFCEAKNPDELFSRAFYQISECDTSRTRIKGQFSEKLIKIGDYTFNMGLWNKYKDWGKRMREKRLRHQSFSDSDENQIKISEAMYLGLAVTFFIILIDLIFELLKGKLNITSNIGELTFKLVAVFILLTLYGVAYHELKSKK